MTDQMTPSELAAVADRIPVVPANPVIPPEPPAHEHLAALHLAEHIDAGDQGAVLRYVNQLEHGLGALRVNPWRLAEHMALMMAIRQQEQEAAAASTDAGPAGGVNGEAAT